MRVRPRQVHGIGALALGAALVMAGCVEEEPRGEVVRPVRAVVAAVAHAPEILQQTGEIRARYEVPVGFRTAGKVVLRPVDVGSAVRAGDILATIDPEPAKSQLRAAVAAVAAARAEMVRARGEEGRQKTVIEKGFTTRTAYDMALRNLQTARAQLESAEAQQALAEQALGYTEVRADTDGVVVAVGATPGQVVAAGQMVVRLARLDEREAVFDIAENLFLKVPPDPEVGVELVGDPRIRTTGTVRYVSPQADPLTRTFTVRVALAAAPPEMRLGASVRGSVALPTEPAVALPGPALLERDGRAAVWIFDPRAATVDLRPVTVQRYSADLVFLDGGVAAGDIVVTAGVHTLRPGQTVRLLEAGGR